MEKSSLTVVSGREIVINFLIFFYFVLSFLSLYEVGLTIINALILLIGCYFLMLNFNYVRKNHLFLLIVFSLFSIYSIFCLFYFQGKVTYTPIRVFVHFSLFIAVLRYNISAKLIQWVLYGYIGYILYILFIQGIYINSIFPGTSKNIIGWFALGLCVFYYVLALEKSKESKVKLDIIPIISTTLICLISLSRSNILCTSLLMGGVLFYNFYNYSIVKRVVFTFLISAAIVFLVYYFQDLLIDSLQRFDERGFESSERSLFFSSYLDKLDIYTFLLGVDSDQYPFTLIGGNFHNSFLLGHSNFGIMFLFFLLFLIQYLARKLVTSFIYVILALTLLIRCFTDTIMFIGYFDFILFIVLYKMSENKKLKKSS